MTDAFVIMPFGVKPVPVGERVIDFDFDRVYRNLVLAACELNSYTARRIDDFQFTGVISREIIKQLFSSDLVIADLTGGNANVFFELGIRQSLTERPTILIAERNSMLPFDVSDQRVFLYDFSSAHSINADVNRLAKFVATADVSGARSPVLSQLRELGLVADPRRAPEFEVELREKILRATSLEQLTAVWNWSSEKSPLPSHLLLDLAERISAHDCWALAASIAERASIERPGDFEVHRKWGWFLRNVGPSEYPRAENEFLRALELNPKDPETLGMLGGLLKRMGRYKEAAERYRAGFQLSPSSTYMQVAQAAMQLLADLSEGSSPVQGLLAYRELHDRLIVDWQTRGDSWEMAVLGECAFVLGKADEASRFFEEASRTTVDPTVFRSPADQIELFASYGFRKELAERLIRRLKSLTAKTKQPDEVVDMPRENDLAEAPAMIVHVSDLHFGFKVDKNGERQRMHRFYENDYEQTLAEHMKDELVKPSGRFALRGKPVFVVCSGDFAYSANDEEFTEALNFLNAVKDALDISREQFVFCPGNHDVNWDLSKIIKERRFDNYISFLRKFYGGDLFAELYPLVAWDFSFDGQRPHATDLISAIYFREERILFASFNSCVYESEQHHYGFISLQQQKKMRALIEKASVDDGGLRVAIVHHHIHPHPDAGEFRDLGGHWVDMSTICDAGLFERFLERLSFDVVLHGHKHQAQLRETVVKDRGSPETVKPLVVCGAGSCGVSSSELAHSTGNHYQVVEVKASPRRPGAEFLRVEWREISLDPGAEWATTKVWQVLGG